MSSFAQRVQNSPEKPTVEASVKVGFHLASGLYGGFYLLATTIISFL